MRVSSTDEVELEVHDLGGSGRAMLVCHATGFLGKAYEAVGAVLTARFHVYLMDFRAHGDSTEPANGRLDWRAMAEDVLAVADAVAVGPISALGHSMGGAALLLAELARPGLLASAYLFEPIVLPDDVVLPVSNVLADAARRRRSTFASKAEAMYRYASRPPLSRLESGVLASYVDHGFRKLPDGRVELKCSPENEAATFQADGKPTVSMLRAVTTPTTVGMSGAEEGWSPAILAPHVSQALPNASLERYEHLGHFGPLEAPRNVAAGVLAAL